MAADGSTALETFTEVTLVRTSQTAQTAQRCHDLWVAVFYYALRDAAEDALQPRRVAGFIPGWVRSASLPEVAALAGFDGPSVAAAIRKMFASRAGVTALNDALRKRYLGQSAREGQDPYARAREIIAQWQGGV